MDYNDKEIELARKYISGDYSDIQLNYWICYYNLDKNKIRDLIDYIKAFEPMVITVKLLIGFMLFHFAACFAYSVITYIFNN